MNTPSVIDQMKTATAFLSVGMMGALCVGTFSPFLEGPSVVGDNHKVTAVTESGDGVVIRTAPLSLPEFVPTTPLAKRLWALRQKAIAAGYVMKSADEIIDEVLSARQ